MTKSPVACLKPSIFVNGEKVKDLQVINGISEYFIDVKPSKDNIYIVKLTRCAS